MLPHDPLTNVYIDKASPIPIWVQIRDALQERIRRRDFAPHEKLPSENELSARFAVSRMTVRQAIQALESEGLVYVKRGEGSFVNNSEPTQMLVKLDGFSREMSKLGLRTHSRMLESRRIRTFRPFKAAYEGLHVEQGGALVEVKRLRYLEEQPYAIESTYLPADIGESLLDRDLDGTFSIYRYLEQECGISLERAEHLLEPQIADKNAAHLLAVKIGSPVLHVTGTTYASGGRPIEYIEGLYRGDKYRLRVDIAR